MPIVHVRIPEGIFDAAAIQALGEGVTKAAADAERIPDDPNRRRATWVLIDEVKPSHWFAAGASQTRSDFIGAIANLYPPEGVLDLAKKNEFAAAFDKVVKDTVPVGDSRPVLTTCVVADVPDGSYGVLGRIFHLSDFVAMGGYEHLQNPT